MIELKSFIKNRIRKGGLGMRGKLTLGFALLALILFLSSIIAIFEYRRMSNYVSELIAENIRSINTAHKLLNACDDYNLRLLTAIGDDSIDSLPSFDRQDFFENYDNLRDAIKRKSEMAMADSVLYAYTAYLLVAGEINTVWLSDFSTTREWYFNRLQPVYYRLRNYIDALTDFSYDALRTNSVSLQESFYRSIMPGVIAVCVGILIVILFLYFIVSRYVNPVRKMLKHIQDYERFDKSYTLKFENSDELTALNNELTDIIEQNLSLKRRFNSSRDDD